MRNCLTLRFSCALAVLLAFAPVALAQGQPNQPPALPTLTKVRGDLYLIENSSVTPEAMRYWGGNITVLLTDEGVVLVDTKFARAHDDVMAKIKSLTDKPIKHVILSHNHGDHTEGAVSLAAMGASVIISADDRDNMARAPNAAWLPSLAYIGQARLFLGGKEIQLYQYRGHTRGDTVVLFPAHRVIVLGDVLTTTDIMPPIINYGDGGTWTDWTKSIDDILTMDFEYAIPGHGPMVTKAQVVEIRNKMVAIQQRVRSLNRERKSQEDISATLLKEFNWAPASNVPGMIQELR